MASCCLKYFEFHRTNSLVSVCVLIRDNTPDAHKCGETTLRSSASNSQFQVSILRNCNIQVHASDSWTDSKRTTIVTTHMGSCEGKHVALQTIHKKKKSD